MRRIKRRGKPVTLRQAEPMNRSGHRGSYERFLNVLTSSCADQGESPQSKEYLPRELP